MVLSLYLIGYVHSSDRYCAGEYMGEYRDSLDAATSACNKNIECNCLCTCFSGNEYCLFKGTRTTTHSNYYGNEAWVG